MYQPARPPALVTLTPTTFSRLQLRYCRCACPRRVGFDNPTSLRLKSCYARYRGLGGLMVWDGEMDDDELLIRGVREQYDNPQCDDFEPPAC